jgi:uncharacterized membrane protein YfcA
MGSLPLQDLTILALSLAAAGAVTGILAGLFGVGGGAVMVPVLYQLFGLLDVPEAVRMQLCVGTSLAVIVPTSIVSYRKHLAKGHVDLDILNVWLVPVVLGVAVGSLVARFAPADLFKIVFVLVAGVTSIRLLFGNDRWRFSDRLPGAGAMRAVGLGIGLLSSLMGIGGGQISNLFMLLFGRPIHQAVATSSGLGIMIAVPGTIGFMIAGWPHMAALPPFSIGYVSILAFLLLMPTTTFFAPYGARLAHALPKRKLELAFGVFLLAVSARFVWSIFT